MPSSSAGSTFTPAVVDHSQAVCDTRDSSSGGQGTPLNVTATSSINGDNSVNQGLNEFIN